MVGFILRLTHDLNQKRGEKCVRCVKGKRRGISASENTCLPSGKRFTIPPPPYSIFVVKCVLPFTPLGVKFQGIPPPGFKWGVSLNLCF